MNTEENDATGTLARAWRRLGDLALWPALYAVGCWWIAAWLTGLEHGDRGSPWPELFVGCCAHAGYLLDRVKLSASRMDPADTMAQPRRFAWLRRHHAIVRGTACAQLLAAAAIALVIRPLLALVPLGVVAGVVIYAGRPADPSRPRPKDLPGAKALLIGGAHAALTGAVLLARHPDAATLGAFVLPGLALWLLVASDAAVCDLDDVEPDRAFGTRSLPVQVGPRRAGIIASLGIASSALLAFAVRPPGQALVYAGALLVTTAPIVLMRRRRDPIDARLILVGLACLAMA